MCPRLGIHQPEWRVVWTKDLARMRLEGQHRQRSTPRRRAVAAERKHRLMAEMHAIKIPDGGEGAALGLSEPGKGSDPLHEPPLAGGAWERKWRN